MRTKSVTLAALVLLSATLAAAAEKRVHRVVDLSAAGRLSIDTHNGSITVKTWNQPRVDIDAVIESGDSGYPQDVDKVEVRITGSGDRVRVESNYDAVPSRMGWFFSSSRSLPLVHYTISMPATAALEVDDHNATLRIAGLRGDLDVTSHNGRVTVEDHAGRASINTHNGSVRVAFSRFVRTSEIETHNGAVEVTLPTDARFSVNARGHHLGVDSDFPAVTREMDRSSYRGQVNGGGPELRFSTHNGSLRLRRS